MKVAVDSTVENASSKSESDDKVVELVGSNLDLLNMNDNSSSPTTGSPHNNSSSGPGGAFSRQHKYKPRHDDSKTKSTFNLGFFAKSAFSIQSLSQEDLLDGSRTMKHARPKDYFDKEVADTILEERYTGFLSGFRNRIQDSNLTKYFLHRTLDPEEADEAVDSLALINALLLTIPFQSMTMIGYDFWDWLESMIEECEKNHYEKHTWEKIYQDTLNCFYSLTYTAVAAVSIAAFYYLARPKNYDKFQVWWNKGAQKVIILMLFCTCVATWSTMALFVTLFNNYANSSSNFCSLYNSPTKNTYTRSAWGGNAFLLFVVLLALYWMI